MGGRGGSGSRNAQTEQYDRFAGGNIEMKTYNKLPKYAQDAVIAVDSYNPREYGYNEPINYNLYYIDKSGTIQFLSEDGSDFMSEVRGLKNDFGKVEDFNIPKGYRYNGGDTFERRRK